MKPLTKPLAFCVMAISAILLPFSVAASRPVLDGKFANLDRGHQQLVDTLQSYGVRVFVNHEQLCKKDVDGLYYSAGRVLAVCQDHAMKNNGIETGWSDNDLDTLRHEAHHVVQDCAAGDGLGGSFRAYLASKRERSEWIVGNLSQQSITRIIRSYSEVGYSEDDIWLELEAAVAANTLRPQQTIGLLNRFCS